MSDNKDRIHPAARQAQLAARQKELEEASAASIREQIKLRADGCFRPQRDDLRRELVQRLALIDQDHYQRGFYNTTVRFTVRHQAQLEHLRALLEARVRTVVEAVELAGSSLDDEVTKFLSSEVGSICSDFRRELCDDAESEVAKSQLGNQYLETLKGAVGRHTGHEQVRAAQLIQAERARQALAGIRSRTSLSLRTEGGPAKPSRIREITDPRFPPAEWLTIPQAAVEFELPEGTLHRWKADLAPSDVGETEPRRMIVLRRSALRLLVQSKKQQG